MLRPILDGQLGAIVHSAYCASIVQDVVPGLRVWLIPHFAVPAEVRADRTELGLRDDEVVIGELGFITPAKRPELLLEAVAKLLRRGHRVRAVLAGEDLTYGPLDHAIAKLGIADHVTVTGFLSEEDLDRWTSAVDICVSLRWPHVGETSGTLMRALASGRPVVIQDVGSWAEVPADAAMRFGDAPDEATALADALEALIEDPSLRERAGAGGKAYVRTFADPDRVADLYVASVTEALGPHVPRPARTLLIDRAGLVEDPEAASYDEAVVERLPDEPARARAVLSLANHGLQPHGAVSVTDPGIWDVEDVASFLDDEGFRVTDGLRGIKVMLPSTRPLRPL
jgi:hypothetical protein